MIPAGGGGWGRSDRLEMPASGVLPKPFGMLPPSHMSWVTALPNSPQRFLHDLARRSAHLRVPNLLTSDQTTVNSLPGCLADEVPLDGAGLDQVEDRSQRASKLIALCCLYVTRGQVGIMKYEDSRKILDSLESCWLGGGLLDRRPQNASVAVEWLSRWNVYRHSLLRICLTSFGHALRS